MSFLGAAAGAGELEIEINEPEICEVEAGAIEVNDPFAVSELPTPAAKRLKV